MSDNELLLAISDMMDIKLKSVNDRLEKIELTQDNDILPRLGKLEQSQERMEQSYERMEQSVGKLEQSYERMEQSYERIEQSYERMEQSYERLEQSYERLELAQKKMELTLENNILPRLQTIEECYLSTYDRYRDGVDQMASMQANIDVIKTTITKHSEILQKLA